MPTEPSERLNELREVQARNRAVLYFALAVFIGIAAADALIKHFGG